MYTLVIVTYINQTGIHIKLVTVQILFQMVTHMSF